MPTTKVTGYARDPSGFPVASATVTDGTNNATTASDGSYSLNANLGNITLTVQSATQKLLTIAGANRQVDFVVDPRLELSGEVVESVPTVTMRPSQPIAYIVTDDAWAGGAVDSSGTILGPVTSGGISRDSGQSSSTDR